MPYMGQLRVEPVKSEGAMELKLILAKGEPKGKEIVVAKMPSSIGRDPGCDVVIANVKVSRKHCSIEAEGDQAVIVDGGSGNGTFVNGQKVERQALKAGDKVVIGPLGFVVEIDGNRGGTAPGAAEDLLAVTESDAVGGDDLNAFLESLEKGAGAAGGDDEDVLQLTDDDLK